MEHWLITLAYIFLYVNLCVILGCALFFIVVYVCYKKELVLHENVLLITTRFTALTWVRYFGLLMATLWTFNDTAQVVTDCLYHKILYRFFGLSPSIIIGIQLVVLYYRFVYYSKIVANLYDNAYQNQKETINYTNIIEIDKRISITDDITSDVDNNNNKNKNNDNDNDSQQSKAINIKHKILTRVKKWFVPDLEDRLSHGYPVKLYILIQTPLFLFPLVAIINAAILGDSYESVCNNIGLVYGDVTGAVVGVIILIIYGYKIIKNKVHDAYFMKKEYVLIIFFTYLPGVLAGFLLYVPGLIGEIAQAALMIALTNVNVVGFLIPVILTVRHLIRYAMINGNDASSSHVSSSATSITTFSLRTLTSTPTINRKSQKDEIDSNKHVEAKPKPDVSAASDANSFLFFTKYEKTREFIKDIRFIDSVNEYLIDIQSLEYIDKLFIWKKLSTYKEINENLTSVCAGRAHILFQRTFASDALLRYNYPDRDHLDELKNTLADHFTQVTDNAPSEDIPLIDQSFFDSIRSYLEDELEENIFKKYFKTNFWTKFCVQHSITLSYF